MKLFFSSKSSKHERDRERGREAAKQALLAQRQRAANVIKTALRARIFEREKREKREKLEKLEKLEKEHNRVMESSPMRDSQFLEGVSESGNALPHGQARKRVLNDREIKSHFQPCSDLKSDSCVSRPDCEFEPGKHLSSGTCRKKSYVRRIWQAPSSLQAQPLMKDAVLTRYEGVCIATVPHCNSIRPVTNLGGRCYMASALAAVLNTKLIQYARPEVQELKNNTQALGNFKCMCQSDHACSLKISAIERKYTAILSKIANAFKKEYQRVTQTGGDESHYLAAVMRDSTVVLTINKYFCLQITDSVVTLSSFRSGMLPTQAMQTHLPKTDVVVFQSRFEELTAISTSKDMDRQIYAVLPPVLVKYWAVMALTMGVNREKEKANHAIVAFRCHNGWVMCDPNHNICTPIRENKYFITEFTMYLTKIPLNPGTSPTSRR